MNHLKGTKPTEQSDVADENVDIGFGFKQKLESTLLLACGALAHEIIALINANRWDHLDVVCLPAKLHHEPDKIPEAVRRKIIENRSSFKKIYVLYGDCGTSGALDKVLLEEGGIERIPGPHCFSFFAGNSQFASSSENEISTFYLTDFFCRFFEKFVWEALGLDRREDMLEFVFGNYTKLVFMPQTRNEELEIKARSIAKLLGLRYEYRYAGYGDLEFELKRLRP